jgi:hypothetical protein
VQNEGATTSIVEVSVDWLWLSTVVVSVKPDRFIQATTPQTHHMAGRLR